MPVTDIDATRMVLERRLAPLGCAVSLRERDGVVRLTVEAAGGSAGLDLTIGAEALHRIVAERPLELATFASEFARHAALGRARRGEVR